MLDTLPSRPLTLNEADGLNQSDRVEHAKPWATLQILDLERVIALFVRTESSHHVLGYTEQNGWEQIVRTSIGVEETAIDAAVDTYIDWLSDNYESGEYLLMVNRHDPETDLTSIFPDHELTLNQLDFIADEHGIDLVPLLCLPEEETIITILVVEPEKQQSTCVGYRKFEGWEIISRYPFDGDVPQHNASDMAAWGAETWGNNRLSLMGNNRFGGLPPQPE